MRESKVGPMERSCQSPTQCIYSDTVIIGTKALFLDARRHVQERIVILPSSLYYRRPSTTTPIQYGYYGAPRFLVLGVPYANADEANHAPNENLEVERFYVGIKTGAAMLAHLGAMARVVGDRA